MTLLLSPMLSLAASLGLGWPSTTQLRPISEWVRAARSMRVSASMMLSEMTAWRMMHFAPMETCGPMTAWLTSALGWMKTGGTIWTFDPSRAKQDYDEEVKAGQQVVEQNYAGVRP